MKKNKEESFVNQVFKKLFMGSYAPITPWDGPNKVKEKLKSHLDDGKKKIAAGETPEPFALQGEGNVSIPYKYELSIEFDEQSSNPTLKSIRLEIGGKKHTQELSSIKDLPPLWYMIELTMSQPEERKQGSTQRTISSEGSKGQKI